MRAIRHASFAAICCFVVLSPRQVATAPAPAPAVPGYQRFLSPASPLELAAAKKADRVAWIAFEEGKRNAYTAAAPAFSPVRLTKLPGGRRHRHVRDPDLGRRVDGDLRARDGAEPRRVGGQRVGRSERSRARHLGRAHDRRPGVPRGRAAERRLRAGAGRQFGALRARTARSIRAQSHAGEAGRRDGSRRDAVHPGVGRAERARRGRPTAGRSRSSPRAPTTASSSSTTWPRGP